MRRGRKSTGSSSDSTGGKRLKPMVFEEYMQDDFALMHLDSRRAGVKLPAQLMGQHSVTLKLSYRFQGKTTLDATGVTAFLKFDGEYAECVMPWSAIWGMSAADNRRTVWPEDLPKELILELARNRIAELGQRLLGRKEGPATAEEKKDDVKLELVDTHPKEPSPSKGKGKPPLKRIK